MYYMHIRYFFTSIVISNKIKKSIPMNFPTPHLKNITILLKACHA